MNTLPAELAALLGATDEHRAPVPLPPGTTVHADEGDGPPVLWMSDGAADPDIWAQLCSAHDSLGLWPLLLTGLDDDEDFRPWGSGELWLDKLSDPRSHDPQTLLSHWWSTYTATEDGDDERDVARRLAVTAPYGQFWPGLAPAAAMRTSAGQRAAAYAAELLAADPSLRLGLVPAGSGAEALRECGWQGPLNYTNDTGEIAAVVLDWERRFGARVVGVGFAELYLSVAAPPTTAEEALRVAAEHFAFCPDNIWQGRHPHTLTGYAEELVDAAAWTFWWD
ncbi:DUF4253 domain-containing protein [Streptomyces sp. NPDC026673]|uniref:DUF4253 domain-containing protein n=1 Tax=Streptomyces sp. NPDC026673 TaxID=3155724 RepID=UPI00340C470C